MATKFVTARKKGVLGRIRVPERTLKHMPGWTVVDGPAVPQSAAVKRRRKARLAAERATQSPASPAAEQSGPPAADPSHPEGA